MLWSCSQCTGKILNAIKQEPLTTSFYIRDGDSFETYFLG